MALRVPVEDGSLVDLACVLETPVTIEEVNTAFREVSDDLGRVIRYTTEPVVSRDVIGDASSCVFDSSLTQANGDLIKVFGWYDNEWGYTNRLADLVEYIAEAA
jgi:glyceraldehyde 3-phosphate dehydrogenase